METNNSKYKVGQVGNYKTRPQEPNSTLTIVKVESSDKLGTIIHISLQGLKIQNSRHPNSFSETIAHLPFAEKAIDHSVTKLVKQNAALPDFQDGYNQWKQAFDAGKGGIFNIAVAEAANIVERPLK